MYNKGEAIMFDKELTFFQKNQDDLVKKYNGKTLVIKDNSVIGAYDTPLIAYQEATKTHKPGSFMLQPCKPGPDAYTVTISSLGIVKTKA
jgi:hypothetical protein